METLSFGSVEIWWLELARLRPVERVNLSTLLDDDERCRAGRFHFDKDRDLYIAGHALLRGLLQRYGSQPAKAWRFTKGDFGKPHAVMPREDEVLHVNLSHVEGIAIAGITRAGEIGVDLETLNRTVEIETLSKRVCSDYEKAQLARLQGFERKRRFLTYWTLKEAYMKAIGQGISYPVERLRFQLEDQSVSLHIEDGEGGAVLQDGWMFEVRDVAAHYRMAVAVPAKNGVGLHINVEPAPLDFLLGLPHSVPEGD